MRNLLIFIILLLVGCSAPSKPSPCPWCYQHHLDSYTPELCLKHNLDKSKAVHKMVYENGYWYGERCLEINKPNVLFERAFAENLKDLWERGI